MPNGKVVVVGAMNMDVVVTTANLPQKGESVIGSPIQLYPGGKGANQAVAAALVGAPTTLISMRGDDDYGRSLLESIVAAGVDTGLIAVSEDEKTGTAVIVVDSHGDNTIVISPGANNQITAQVADEALRQLDRPAVVSVCGELQLSTIKAALETASELGAVSVLNLSPYNRDAIALLPLAQVLVVNQHEAADITGQSNAAADWRATAAAFAAVGSTLVVVTLGADGAMVLDCQNLEVAPFKVEAIQVRAVDTTGCGDAFTGSLCAELASGKSLTDAAKFAVQVAGFAATSAGAQVSYGSRSQVENLVQAS